MASPRLLLIFTSATALVIGAVVLLMLGSWWLLAVAMLIHLAATVLVIGAILKRTEEADKPDPVTEARLEEEAMKGPEPDEPEARDTDDPVFAIPRHGRRDDSTRRSAGRSRTRC
jgi:hypothetical protein